MLRITKINEDGNAVRLRLDGKLAQESFTKLAQICQEHGDGTENIILIDMAGVTFMNDETAEKLLDLRGERLRIINCSPFVEMLLNSKQNDFASGMVAVPKHTNRHRRNGNG
ncbi:MAG: hypothetical protein OEN50_10205 [Deltaproteobacteria bacterium]|nr:hypothetical protein [Deltaproteobacteria bacterium]